MTPPDPHSRIETLEEDALVAGLAAAGTLRVVELAAVALVGLFVCAPLAILVVIVAAPFLAVALVGALLATPFLLVQHLRGTRNAHR